MVDLKLSVYEICERTQELLDHELGRKNMSMVSRLSILSSIIGAKSIRLKYSKNQEVSQFINFLKVEKVFMRLEGKLVLKFCSDFINKLDCSRLRWLVLNSNMHQFGFKNHDNLLIPLKKQLNI